MGCNAAVAELLHQVRHCFDGTAVGVDGTLLIAHVERERSLKRGDLLAIHRELGRDESIPSFLAHLLKESIHLGTAGPTTHNVHGSSQSAEPPTLLR